MNAMDSIKKNKKASKAKIQNPNANGFFAATKNSTAIQKPRSQSQGAPLGWIPSARLGKNRKKTSRKSKPRSSKNRKRAFWSHFKAQDNLGVELFSGAPIVDDDLIVDKILKLKISNPYGGKHSEKKKSTSASQVDDLNKENVQNKLWADKSDLEDDEIDKKENKISVPQIRTFGVQFFFENEVQRLKYLNFIRGELPKNKPVNNTTQKEIVKDYLKEKKKPDIVENKKQLRIAKRAAKQAKKEKAVSTEIQDTENSNVDVDEITMEEILTGENNDAETAPILNSLIVAKKTLKKKKTKKLRQKKNIRQNTRSAF